MKKPWWTWTGVLTKLNRKVVHGGKSWKRKWERRAIAGAACEVRQYLSAVVNVQPLTITAGQAGSFQVCVDGQLSAPVTVDYTLVDGTAAQGSDYCVPGGNTLAFLPGQTTPDTVSVYTAADPTAAADKFFTLLLCNPTGDLGLGTSQAVCTIDEPGAAQTAAVDPTAQNAGAAAAQAAGIPSTPACSRCWPLRRSTSLVLRRRSTREQRRRLRSLYPERWARPSRWGLQPRTGRPTRAPTSTRLPAQRSFRPGPRRLGSTCRYAMTASMSPTRATSTST